jgi:hypothetical protein
VDNKEGDDPFDFDPSTYPRDEPEIQQNYVVEEPESPSESTLNHRNTEQEYDAQRSQQSHPVHQKRQNSQQTSHQRQPTYDQASPNQMNSSCHRQTGYNQRDGYAQQNQQFYPQQNR